MQDDAASILDILLACRRVTRFTEGVDETAFQADEEKRWAVFSQLLIIGEAANRLSVEFQADHVEIPWPQTSGMRNRLIHEYDKVNWHLVWRTATEDLPALSDHLAGALPPDSTNDGGGGADN